MNVFLDTNILLDFIVEREPHFEAAKSTIITALEGGHSLFVSANCITDIFYITKRLGIDIDAVRLKFERILTFVDVVDITRNDIIKTLKVDCKDFEDALQVRCAEKVNADYIITRDKEFERHGIKVISPQEFIKM